MLVIATDIQFYFRVFLTPANKVWGQGNVFTPVCQSFCSCGVLSLVEGAILAGVPYLEVSSLAGGAVFSSGAVLSRSAVLSRGFYS